MKKKSLELFSILALIFFTSMTFGQGVVIGVVSDAETGKPLIGANVLIVGTSLGSATNIEGEYRIAGVSEGKHQLRISYLGYQTKIVDVDIVKDKTLKIDVDLEFEIIEGTEIVVTGQMAGQVAAINQQLNSNTIVNVVSEEKIQELPDANAAEAIGRLPGVSIQRSGGEANKIVLRGMSDRYSSVTIDGVRIAATDADSRGIDLSTISQGNLAGIELFKALTSDMDADAIAGSVNLVTKRAPEKREIKIDAKGAYGQLDKNAEQYDFAVKYGERFFDNFLGVQVTGNIEQRDRSNENFNYSYNTTNYRNPATNDRDYVLNRWTTNYTNEVRKRKGTSLLLDINTPDGGYLKLNNTYNQTNRDYIIYTRQYDNTGTSNQSDYSAQDVEREINMFNTALSGKNYILGLEVDYSFSFAQSKASTPYDYQIGFIEPSSDTSGLRSIPASLDKGPAELWADYAFNNFSAAYADRAYYTGEKNLEKNRAAVLNFKKDYTFSKNITGALKFGAKYKDVSRYRSQSQIYSVYYNGSFSSQYVNSSGQIVDKPFYNDMYRAGSLVLVRNFIADPKNLVADSRMVDDKYALYPMLDRDYVRWFYENNKTGVGEYVNNAETDALYYDVKERISSGYIMNTLQFGQWLTFIAGIRLESENNSYSSIFTSKNGSHSAGSLSGYPELTGTLRDTTNSHYEDIWLPNFQATIKATDWLNFRVAAYRALARPDFTYRLNNFVARSATTFFGGAGITTGNPNLKTAKAWNFEFNTSFYGNKLGLLTLSAFYKEIKDMYQFLNSATFQQSKHDVIDPETGLYTDHTIDVNMLDTLGINWINPLAGDYTLDAPYNSKKPTKVWGFEVEHQTNLSFLPGLLSHIVFSYNYSLVRSETYVLTAVSVQKRQRRPLVGVVEFQETELVERKQTLVGQPEHFGNVALGYDIGGFSGRLSLFMQGRMRNSYSSTGQADGMVNEYYRLDLSLKQQILDFLELTLNINNLTNTKESRSVVNPYYGWDLERANEIYGLTGDLGVRLTL